MRYGEQVFEIAVPLETIEWESPDLAERLRAAFHARHRTLFTYDLPEEEVVMVNARVAVVGTLDRGAAAASAVPAALVPGQRRIVLGGDDQEVSVHRFDALELATDIVGPAIIESATTTVLLQPGDHARMDRRGWLEICLPTTT